jgi:hypothetical protein
MLEAESQQLGRRRSLVERVDKILGTLGHAKKLQIGQQNPS